MFNDFWKLAGPRHHLPIIGMIALILCAHAMWPASAQDPAGGDYKEIRDFPASDRDAQNRVRQMIESGTVSDRATFDAVFNDLLSRFTWKSFAGRYAEMRGVIKNRYLRRASGQAHTELNALVLQWMERLASDEEFHWTVRCNATYMLGDLNRVEPQFGGQGAVPLPEAAPILLSLVDSDDVVAVAAVVQLKRHAEADALDGNRKIEVAGKMLELIADENRHAWIHRRAADLLGVLQLPGTGRNSANVIDALSGMIANKESSSSLRATAAGALSQINFDAAPQNVEYASLAEQLTALAVDVGKDSKSVRRLIAQLHRVDEALNGRVIGRAPRGGEPPREGGLVKAAADTPHAEYVQAAGEKVGAMMAPLMNLDSESDSDVVPPDFREPLTMAEAWMNENPPEGKIAQRPGGN